MYKRFLKWSSERIKGNGMVVFVSNNSFLDGKANDGFRKAVYDEFDYIYTVNLRGRFKNIFGEELKMEGENIFNILVGVAISFFIKTKEIHSEIQYAEIADYMKKVEKLKWLDQHSTSTLEFKKIIPDKNSVWLNQTDNDFDELLPVLPRQHNESIFKISTMGVGTNKDEWVYDFDLSHLKDKMKYYVSIYNDCVERYKTKSSKILNLHKWVDKKIKWSRTTVHGLKRKKNIVYSKDKIKSTLYRPFVIKHQYYDNVITHYLAKFPIIFKNKNENLLILFKNPDAKSLFDVISSNILVDSHACYGGTQIIPLHSDGKNNTTQFALKLFCKHYKNKSIKDIDIFYYVYAMFNDPKYEKTYRHNLRRGFPRIPLAKDFEKYSKIGKQLFVLHCNFNDVKEYDLERIEKTVKNNKVKLSLKIPKEKDSDTELVIIIDNRTTLKNIPKETLEYTLNSKSPLKWILDYHKEKKNHISESSSDDESIRKQFNTYKFEDHKEKVITLLRKITTVCVETVKLRKELEKLEWGPQPKLIFTEITKEIKKPKKKNKSKKTMIDVDNTKALDEFV